ncbi:MAG: hypothetical protein FWC38_09280 [Proteobacteria bacterium]|nr:hypothetical protein [Pseudomonadota bacterium]MCL2308390.1 hypothetical protein [Pseudomonadota bacterium]
MIGVLTMMLLTDLPPLSSAERALAQFRHLVSPSGIGVTRCRTAVPRLIPPPAYKTVSAL